MLQGEEARGLVGAPDLWGLQLVGPAPRSRLSLPALPSRLRLPTC